VIKIDTRKSTIEWENKNEDEDEDRASPKAPNTKTPNDAETHQIRS
jgi:hypothetical protein